MFLKILIIKLRVISKRGDLTNIVKKYVIKITAQITWCKNKTDSPQMHKDKGAEKSTKKTVKNHPT